MSIWSRKSTTTEAELEAAQATISQLRKLNEELYARAFSFEPATKEKLKAFGEGTRILVLKISGVVVQATIKQGVMVNYKGHGIAINTVRGVMIQPGVSNGLRY